MNSIFEPIERQIPSISNEELERRLKLSVACVIEEAGEGKFLCPVLNPHHTNDAYTWSQKNGAPIGQLFSPRDVFTKNGKYHDRVALEISEFITLHDFGHPLMFKPSIKEVLSQLPAYLFDEEKLQDRKLYYNTKAFNSHAPSMLLNQDYHVAITTVWHSI